MALLDDLHHIVSIQDTWTRIRALESAYWIFERNPCLSLGQQAEGIAFLVEAYLRENEDKVRDKYTWVIAQIVISRSYSVGTKIDWTSLTGQLPYLSSSEVFFVLFIIKYANDEKYLSILESYFDDFEKGREAVSSWITLAYTQRYKYDSQVQPYFDEAQKVINKHFSDWHKQTQQKLGRVNFTVEELYIREEERATTKQLIMKILNEAQEKIRQQIQIHDRTAYIKEWNAKELYKEELYYLPNQIQSWLALPERKDKVDGRIGNLDWVFEKDTLIPIDEVAQAVKVLADYALTGDDTQVRSLIWNVLTTAFEARGYVGTYLDWKRLIELLKKLCSDDNHSEFKDLEHILSYFGYANNKHYLAILKPYLEHRNIQIRFTAAKAIDRLLCQLAHYCPEVMLLSREANNAITQIYRTPNASEKWQFIKDVLSNFEQNAYPYFHYYSI